MGHRLTNTRPSQEKNMSTKKFKFPFRPDFPFNSGLRIFGKCNLCQNLQYCKAQKVFSIKRSTNIWMHSTNYQKIAFRYDVWSLIIESIIESIIEQCMINNNETQLFTLKSLEQNVRNWIVSWFFWTLNRPLLSLFRPM